MKGIILSGGKGTRLRPLTYTGAKQLVPVANKPVLFYALEDLVEAGIDDIAIVVPADFQMAREQIMAAVGDGGRFGARITYIEQDAPRGLAHAVGICREFVGDEKFVVFLGDNFIREGIRRQVEVFRRGAMNGILLLYRVPNPQGLGIAVVQDGRVVELQEKPQVPKSDLAIVGIYLLDHHFFAAAEGLRPSARGELEITDALSRLLESGYDIRPEIVDGYWIDTGRHIDMLDANRLVLDAMEARIEGEVDAESKIVGRVTLEAGAKLIRSVVRGPAIIGRDAVITDTFIGPFTAIGDGCRISRSELEHSIVLEHSVIEDIETRIEDSLIGRNVQLSRSEMKPRAHKLLLGDNSQVGLA
ncbi:MAG TPA: glucose-1-phosphate thymidylyltransferase [Chloroflexota bacterium]|jgi:glucose-1-phosphate thymidylyltransferase|nr:glucose-1-phosphate thymidylyltransferase [Chloroflexota bacterium]